MLIIGGTLVHRLTRYLLIHGGEKRELKFYLNYSA